MDDFDHADPFPANWEDFADFLNGIIDARIAEALKGKCMDEYHSRETERELDDIAAQVWAQYCAGELDGEDGFPKLIRMVEYEIDLTKDGIISHIDTVTAPEGYTAEKYIGDCLRNANEEWCHMIQSGTITVVPDSYI